MARISAFIWPSESPIPLNHPIHLVITIMGTSSIDTTILDMVTKNPMSPRINLTIDFVDWTKHGAFDWRNGCATWLRERIESPSEAAYMFARRILNADGDRFFELDATDEEVATVWSDRVGSGISGAITGSS